MIKAGFILENCHDCGAKPGEPHRENCDVERCSVCGGQRLQCNCLEHDSQFARWTGIWPGKAEATFLGMDLNEFEVSGLLEIFFIKPAILINLDCQLKDNCLNQPKKCAICSRRPLSLFKETDFFVSKN